MPPPAAVYVAAVVGTVAAAAAFKQFVYDPHIHPTVERWQHQLKENWQRRRRRGAAPVPSDVGGDPPTDPGTELRNLRPHSGSDAGDDWAEEERSNELERMVAREVNEWRNGVETGQGTLRQRRTNQSGNALEESNHYIPYNPLSPTQMVFNFSSETSPTTVNPPTTHSAAIRVAGPPSTIPDSPMSSVRPSDSISAVGQQTPQVLSPEAQPRSLSFTYDARALSLSPPVVVSPNIDVISPAPSSPAGTGTAMSGDGLVIRPSLPQGLGLDLFPTPPISRPETPFSSLSVPDSPGYDFASPRLRNLSIPTSPIPGPSTGRTLSEADFVSAASQTPSRTASEIDFMSAVGGDHDQDHFDVMSPPSHGSGSPDLSDDFDLGDDSSEADSWASISHPRR